MFARGHYLYVDFLAVPHCKLLLATAAPLPYIFIHSLFIFLQVRYKMASGFFDEADRVFIKEEPSGIDDTDSYRADG